MTHWLARIPHWSAALLGVLIVTETAHEMLALVRETRDSAAPGTHDRVPDNRRFRTLDLRQITAAHLFGIDPASAHADGARAAPEELHLALQGVIATTDPDDGFAILGEPGQSARLYRTGAALTGAAGGTLRQVFPDHVVLEFGDRRQTLALPRRALAAAAGLRFASTDAPGPPQAPGAVPVYLREEPPSALEGWFSNLYAEPYSADGRTALRLHPAKHFQRRYGLREGDTLTAVNGVPVANEAAVQQLLQRGGKSVALTVTRDGSQETLSVSLE